MPLNNSDGKYECVIPWEVIAKDTGFCIGVFGGDSLRSDLTFVAVTRGAQVDGELPQPPTPDWYDNIERITDEAVNTAKEVQQKANNGEFDGKPGKDGADGKDGYTPQKGIDYYTEEDKAEMLDSVKTAFEPDVQAINQTAERALSIAKGRATGYVFDTLADLETALTDEEFVANLVLGDNFYIKALDVPDYWWDGEQKQELETEKPNLTGFVTSDEVQTMINDALGVIENGSY